MIPEQAIIEWRREAPWSANAMVEQDLIISRAIVEIYSVPEIAERLAFRGGTALYKLHLHPAARYSEDIDLVQVRSEPIGETLDLLRGALDPWLGKPKRKLKRGRVNLEYRVESEDSVKMRLKIEINSREHFTELGLIKVPFQVSSQWFQGQADVTSFALDEMLGTKFRALYQRKKGRDLFDLWYALDKGVVNPEILVQCFDRYMKEDGNTITRALFEANLHEKADRPEFCNDIIPLLRPGLSWNFNKAFQTVLNKLISKLPGEPWKGNG
jgi:predicted nucleotidyltransferase component of viral defense system